MGEAMDMEDYKGDRRERIGGIERVGLRDHLRLPWR